MAAEIANEILAKLRIPEPYINDHEKLSQSALGLDAIIGLSLLLTIIHAGISRSLSTLVGLFVLALTVEQLSVQLGATHCHTEAIVMISKCSSLNSILFYVFWMYLSLTIAQGLNLSTFGTISVAGLAQAMFGLCYELQGPTFNWWQYNSENVAGAFDERIFGLPLMGVYFHMAFGSAFAACIKLAGGKHLTKSSLPRVLFAAFLTPTVAMFFDIPIRVFMHFGVDRFTSVPAVSFLLFALPAILSKSSFEPKNVVRAPAFFFFIVFQFHAYFVAAPFVLTPHEGKKVTPELLTAVGTTIIASLALAYTAAFCQSSAVSSSSVSSSSTTVATAKSTDSNRTTVEKIKRK